MLLSLIIILVVLFLLFGGLGYRRRASLDP